MKKFNLGVSLYTVGLLLLKYLCGLDISSWLIWTPLVIYTLVWLIIAIFYFGMICTCYASLYVTLTDKGESLSQCTMRNASKATAKICLDYSLYKRLGKDSGKR